MTGAADANAHNVLVLSDLHLTLSRDAEDEATDREIIAFLRQYQDNRVAGRPWRLVLAGDVFDLLYPDMALFVARDGHPEDAPRGGARGALEHWDVDALAWRVRSTMRQRADLFVAVARFVEAGHDVVFVKGNHDVELQWAPVRRALLDTLHGLAVRAGVALDRETLGARVRFHDWFYAEEGQIWVEHGNQYDEFNSYPNFLDPALVTDPHRAFMPMGSRMTQYLTNAFLDYKPGPAHGTFMGYIWRTRQLLSPTFLGRSVFVLRDALTKAGLFSEEGWRTGAGREDAALTRMARSSGVPEPTLRALQGLQVPPATAVRGFFFDRMLLDRVFVVAFTLLMLAIGLAWGLFPPTEPSLLAALASAPVAIAVAAFVRFKQRRRTLGYKLVLVGAVAACTLAAPLVLGGGTWQGILLVAVAALVVGAALTIMPVPDMMDLGVHLVRTAAEVRRLTGARIVVFGHHHRPRFVELHGGGVYVNCGAWVNTGIVGNHAHLVAVRDERGDLHATLMRGRSWWTPEG